MKFTLIVELDMSNLALAIQEIKSLSEIKQIKNNFYLTKIKNPEILGMTKNAYKILNNSEKVKGSFKAISHTNLSNKEFAKMVWERTEKKVKLKNPDNELHLFDNYITKKFWSRNIRIKSNKWEYNHPTSTNPNISRAMINIAKTKKVFDPFCGAGGILIEAGLMKKKVEGIDIDKIQIKRAKNNLKQFKIKAKLTCENSFEKKWYKIIVSDLPYGRNSKIQKNFFENFFIKVKDCERAIIGIPSNIVYPIENVVFETEIYLHKSLTKRIILIEY